MLIIEHTVETKATVADVWRVWQDVSNWKSWDHGIEFSEIYGPFATGTRGVLQPKGGPVLHTQLTRVEQGKMFVDESKLFLCRIIVSHYLKEMNGKLEVTHRIEMKGPLALLFAFLIGRTMKKNLPIEMMAMVKRVESR